MSWHGKDIENKLNDENVASMLVKVYNTYVCMCILIECIFFLFELNTFNGDRKTEIRKGSDSASENGRKGSEEMDRWK